MTRHTIKALSDTLLKCAGRCKTAPFSVTGMNLIARFSTIALVGFVVALPAIAFAQGFVPLAPITGLTDPGTATSIINENNFAFFFNNLYKFSIGLAAALAVIMIIWGGLEISTQDSITKQGAGRERITQAILGLILVLSPVLVFSIINPSILNLDIGIKKLDTVRGVTVQVTPTVSCPQYFSGTPPNCVALPLCNNVLQNNANMTVCTPVAVGSFDEGPYPSLPTGAGLPPAGVWCYQINFTYQGNNYMCYRDQAGCQASCRTSGTTENNDVYARIPNANDPNCTAACA